MPKEEKLEKQKVIEVEKVGEKMILPEAATYDECIKRIETLRDQDEMVQEVKMDAPVHPYDGANCLRLAVEQVTGYALAVETPGMFWDEPPKKIRVQTGPDSFETIWWGRLNLPFGKRNNEAYLEPVVSASGRFNIVGQCKLKHVGTVNRIFDLVREMLPTISLYAGKAFKANFWNEKKEALPIPEFTFWPLYPGKPIYNEETERAIYTSILTPIRHHKILPALGMDYKGGILLVGKFGVGKTLLASYVASVCIENDVGFMYLQDIRQLVPAIQYIRGVSSVVPKDGKPRKWVVFGEDIDKVTAASADPAEVNKIQNTLDGVDTKNLDVRVILTTNFIDQVGQALLRPGRLEVIEIEEPNAKTILRLFDAFGGDLLSQDPAERAQFPRAADFVKGTIPDVIRQVINNAKLAVLDRTGTLPEKGCITADDIITVSRSMETTKKLLAPVPVDKRSDIEKAADKLVSGFHQALVPISTGGAAIRELSPKAISHPERELDPADADNGVSLMFPPH